MSKEEVASGEAAVAEEQSVSLLEQAVAATSASTERSEIEELLKTFTSAAMSGTIAWDKNLLRTVNAAISKIDETISKQLAEIMHHDKFVQIEGSWRGLNHLVMNSETSTTLKIKVFNADKRTLFKDLDKAVEFDQSQLFKKLYEDEYGTPGGQPYGALIGDYTFGKHPEDVEMLTQISGVCAASFCPFISSADSSLLGLESWSDLSKPRDLAKIFDTAEYAKWQSFRDSDDSKFVSLTMPRVLSRLPYGKDTKSVDEFDFEEAHGEMEHKAYAWMNASYAFGAKLTEAFSKYGFCTAIRGAEGGGKVEGLPTHTFLGDDGDVHMKCPTEIAITDRREAELSKLGLLPVCHYKNTDYAVFFGAQSVQKPKVYNKPEATANAAISARLPYTMATSRFAHYLKVMARDKIGSFMEVNDVQDWLNTWIKEYVVSNADAGQELKSKFPLAEARVSVEEVPGAPGSYNAVAWLRPWLQLEELTTSMRMVAKIPKLGS